MLNSKKTILSALGGFCLICLISSGAFAAPDNADWSLKAAEPSFNSATENTAVPAQLDVDVQNFTSKNEADKGSTVDLGEFLYNSFRGNQTQKVSSDS